MPSAKPLQIDILFDDPQWGKARLGATRNFPHIMETALKTMPRRPKAPLEITVTLSNDKAIKVLNRDHRGMNKPTNVLSFPLWDQLDQIPASREAVPIGDIVIAYETMAREAVEQGKTLRDHLAHMLVHGFLHLLGYDHLIDSEAEEMEALEVKILKKLGIKDPYAD